MALADMILAAPAAPAPVARFESAVASVQGLMFVIGGHKEPDLTASDETWAYDPAADRWIARARAPKAISHLTAAVQDDRYIWLVGGYEGQHPGVGVKASFRYDAADDRWEDGPPLPAIRASGGLAVVGRLLHYFGGLEGDRVTNRDDHWTLELDAPAVWRPHAPIPFARTHAATAVLNDQIYAIGGHYGHDVPGHPGRISWEPDLDYVHRYDPTADAWEAVRPLTRRRSHCEPGTFVHQGRIVCIGGRNNGGTMRCQCERTLMGHYFNRLKRKIDVIRGARAAGPTLDDVIAYDPARDRWEDIGRLPGQLYAPAAAVVGDEVIVTNGGRDGWKNPSDETWRLRI